MKKGKIESALLQRMYLTKKLRSLIDRLIDEQLEQHSLTNSQFFILTALMREPEMSQAMLASYLGLSSAAVSKQFKTLVQQKLIRRTTAHDRRKHELAITARGMQLLAQAEQQLAKSFIALFGRPKTIDHLANKHLEGVLTKVERYISEHKHS